MCQQPFPFVQWQRSPLVCLLAGMLEVFCKSPLRWGWFLSLSLFGLGCFYGHSDNVTIYGFRTGRCSFKPYLLSREVLVESKPAVVCVRGTDCERVSFLLKTRNYE